MTERQVKRAVPVMVGGTEVLASAWRWVLRMRNEALTEGDLAEWLTWYEASEAHRQAFESVQTFWHDAQRVLEGAGALTLRELLDSPAADLRHPSLPEVAQIPSSYRRLLGAAATALALLVSFVLFSGRVLRAPSTPRSELPAPPVSLVREDTLSDGTRVDLAPKTTLVLRFTERMRTVELEGGEAYFSVIHNAVRPFVVKVGDLRVRDVGTTFNVRKSGKRIVVVVFKGEVDATRSSDGGVIRVLVKAGQQVTWGSDSSRPVVAPANLARTLEWEQGRLVYLNEPLSAVIADINRYTKKKTIIDDPTVSQLAFSGTVFTDATSVWIHALPRVFPVTLLFDAHGNRVLVRRRSQ